MATDSGKGQANDTSSMSDETLLQGFEQAVRSAVDQTHDAGRWTAHVENGEIVRVYPDGRREHVRRVQAH